ncbi:MAG: type I DNA topoisomerase [Candidatus Hydrogenedentota bacterium]
MDEKSKHLVIVESPAKAKTINKFLGNEYLVTACFGHIKDLPRNVMGININKNFEPQYITIPGKGKILTGLKAEAGEADKVYLATDPDREGETISSHLYEELKKINHTIYRITFNEITRDAIKEAIQRPEKINMNLVQAGVTRRQLDRLVGYELSPLLWKKVMKGLSAGRVQSVALRLICEREKEIKDFVKEEYWKLSLQIEKDGKTVIFYLCDEKNKEVSLKNEDECRKIIQESINKRLIINSIEKKIKYKNPAPPFITSTLQQEASKKLRFTAKKTMLIAQKLYEGMDIGDTTVGLVTYIRTDSVRVNEKAIFSARKKIEEMFGNNYLPEKPNFYRSKRAIQDAHEAIRPTDVSLIPQRIEKYLDRDSYKLYRLIYYRFIASQMKEAVYEQTNIIARCGDYLYKTSGSILKFDGFLKCWLTDEDETEEILPEFKEGEGYDVKEFKPEQYFTQPPPRYNEAALIKTLEENGVGRPSTYAVIISTIQDRRYVKKEKGRFVPTELGMMTNELLIKSFPEIVDVEFTARLEEQLDDIEEGKKERVAILKSFYDIFKKDVEKAKLEMPDIKKNLEKKTDYKCEICGSPMVVKWGKYGQFLACSKFPDCRFVKSIVEKEDGSFEIEKEERLDEKCPECGRTLVYKKSRFGRFVACSGYPLCKYTSSEKLGMKCPMTGCEGEIIIITNKRGRMYGCSEYPECQFRSYYKPVDKKCDKCGSNIMVEKESKKDGKYLECINKGCKNRVIAL